MTHEIKAPAEERPDPIRAALMQETGHAREQTLREAIRLCQSLN